MKQLNIEHYERWIIHYEELIEYFKQEEAYELCGVYLKELDKYKNKIKEYGKI